MVQVQLGEIAVERADNLLLWKAESQPIAGRTALKCRECQPVRDGTALPLLNRLWKVCGHRLSITGGAFLQWFPGLTELRKLPCTPLESGGVANLQDL